MLIVNYSYLLILLLLVVVSSQKPTYFSSYFSAHREGNHLLLHFLLSKKMLLKEEFNVSLQHAFFDQGKDFYCSKIHLIHHTKFNKHSKRKIIFSSPSITTILTSYLRTVKFYSEFCNSNSTKLSCMVICGM